MTIVNSKALDPDLFEGTMPEEVLPHFKEGEYEWFVLTPNSWGRSESSEHEARKNALSCIEWSCISSERKEVPIIIYQIKAGLDLDVDEFYKLTWEGDDRDIQKIAKVIAKRPKRATGLK
tara:strand:- start:24 stop:383 length:360 start_codon:yes stop_codon:yes gene_type:complete